MALGPSYSDLYRRAATYLDKIFKGAKPTDCRSSGGSFKSVVSLNR